MGIFTEVENVCPKCGSHLVIQDGQFGEFLACPRFPHCKYTESLAGGKELKLYKPPSPYCAKCNHTGLIPFIKNGKVISDAFVYCECYKEPQDHYQPIKPEDFDFPMSDTFRGWSFEYCGQPDPGRVLYQPDTTEPQREVEDTPWTNRQWDAVQQVKAEVLFLQGKINEHIDKTKKARGKY